MNKLDFLSGAPKTFIFERNSNKTNLGGVFTLIYLIIIVLIIFAYIYSFEVNIKYSLLYSYEHEYNYNNKNVEEKLKDERFNPEITYNIRMNTKINDSNFFILPDLGSNDYMNFGKDYKTKAYNLQIIIGYNCEKLGENDYNCSIREKIKHQKK